jgi:hypothetical protein
MRAKLKFLGVLSILTLMGCSTVQRPLQTSNAIPAAEGRMTINLNDDHNSHLKVNVKRLASPEEIRPGASNYVVWMRPAEGTEARPQNMGTLLIDDKLEGSLDISTPLQAFNLFVTAETNGKVSGPSGEQLMWASYAPATQQ